MSSLVYVGNKGSVAQGIAVKKNVDDVKGTGLTQAQIDSRITSRLSGYTTNAYVDQQDGLRASKAYVDQQDLLRIPKAWKDLSNGGPIGLGSTGDIALARIPTAYRSYQRGHRAYYSPSSYNANVNSASTSETTLYTCPIADPGMAYRILVWAYMESISTNANAYAGAFVRVGSTAGPIIARGYGPWRSTHGALNIMPDNTSAQAARTGATTLYIRGAKQGSGSDTVLYGGFLSNMCVMLVPA